MQDFEGIEGKLKNITSEYNRILELLEYEEVLLDKKLFLRLSKQKSVLEPIALKYIEYENLCDSVKEIDTILDELPDGERADFEKERVSTIKKMTTLKNTLYKLLLSLNAEMQRVVIEVAALKGDLSMSLQSDIITGYSLWAEDNSLSVEYNKESSRLSIVGLNARELFISEMGIHQAKSEKKTGTCQVYVFDNLPEGSTFDLSDVEVVASRSSGAGGQHINTTDSAIKATHTPTHISTFCQEERSQLQNKEKAIERLRAKVEAHYENELKIVFDSQRKEQLKKFKTMPICKTYDYNDGIIVDSTGREVAIKDFLKGRAL